MTNTASIPGLLRGWRIAPAIIVGCWLLFGGQVALAGSADKLDQIVASAANQASPAGMQAGIAAAAAELRQLTAGLEATKDGSAVALSSRSRIIDALQTSAEFEKVDNALEAIRLLARVAGLSASVADTEAADAQGRRSLDRVTRAVYDRVVRLSATDKNAAPPMTLRQGDRLLYRLFFKSKDKLVAAELAGNDKTLKVEWRQAALPDAQPALIKALSGLTRSGGEATPGMALVVPEGKGALLDQVAAAGLLPVVVEAGDSTTPVLDLPAIEQADAGPGAADGIQLIELSSGALVAYWSGALSQGVVSEAVAIACEVAGDLGTALTEVPVEKYLRRAVAAGSEAGRFFAVATARKAVLADERGTYTIEPWFALEERSRLGPDWGAFKVHDTNKVVWLRRAWVGTYIEFPEMVGKTGLLDRLYQMATGDTAERSAVVSRKSSLRARPYAESEILAQLPGGAAVSVIYEQEAPAAEPTEEVGQAKPSKGKPKPESKPDSWAFVRADRQLGWVKAAELRAEVMAEEPAKEAKPARKSAPKALQ